MSLNGIYPNYVGPTVDYRLASLYPDYVGEFGAVVVQALLYFDKLYDLGYRGSLTDRHAAYLRDRPIAAEAVPEMQFQWLRALGYTGPCTTSMLQEKATAEGYKNVSELWKYQGMIPK